ncbi:hypothetical protein OC845_001427 [Tilletia horrida]|nr:hypothetical protein OC845_001427 [Tilletia horrida]
MKGGPLMGLARAKESDAQRDLLLPGFSTPPRKAIRLPQLYADSESEERLEEDLRFSPDSPAGLWPKKKGLGTISTKSQTNLLISDPIIGPQLTRASSTPDLTKFCFGNSNPGPVEDHQKVTFFMQKLKVKDGGVLVSTPAESKLVKKPSFSRLLSRTSTDDTPVPSTVATNSLSIRAIRKGLSGDMRKGVQKPTGPHLVSAQSDSEQHNRLGGPSLETRPTTPPPFSDLITMPTPTARQSKAERLLGLSAGAAAAISSTNQPKYTSSSGVELPRTASSLSASNATQPYARVRSPFELLPRSTTPVPRSSWKQTIAAVTIRRESDRTELQGSRKRVPVLRYDPMRRPKDGFYHGSVSPPQSVGHPWYPGGELGSESDSTSSHHKSSESSHIAAEDVTLSVLINKSRGALTRKLSGTVNLVTRRQQKPTEGRCQQSTGIVMAPPLSQNFSRRWAISPLPHPTYDLPAVPVQHPPPPIEKDPWLLQPCSSTPCVAVLPSRYKPVEAAQVPRYSFAFLAADSRRGSCDYRSDARASSPELDRAVYI